MRFSIAGFLVVGCSSTSAPVRAPKDVALELRVRLDRTGTEQIPARYAVGDPVVLHVELVNRSDGDVDVIAPVLRFTTGDPWSTLAPVVMSGHDTPMLAPDGRVTHTIWNMIAPPPETIPLAAGDAWRGEIPLYSKAWSWMYGRESIEYPGNFEPGSHGETTLLPGHYAVAVEYTTRWTEAAVQGFEDWQALVDRVWRGTIVSNRVSLDIAP